MPCSWRSVFSTSYVFRRYTTARSAVTLRPYQESCLQACLEALQRGASRIGVSLPTGAGKTTVFISLLSRLSAPSLAPEATRSLVIVNSVELANQTAQQAKRLFPNWSVEVEQGKHSASGSADLTVATFQTLLRGQRLDKFDPRYLKAVIVDEAHHAAAPAYRSILSRIDPAIKHPDNVEPPTTTVGYRVPILGFSATFSRHDGLALGSVFEEIVYHRDFLEMIKEQWLCNVRFTTVHANMDLSGVTISSRSGDFNATSLAHVVNTDTVNELIVRTWLDIAGDRRSTLIFCVNISHVLRLTAAFRDAGVDARLVHSGTPSQERKELIQKFRDGAFPVLINCAVLTEGTDIPNIDCVVVARPTRSRNVFTQMIGRGMRLSPDTGKQDCRIIDIVDSQERVSSVVSIPTLLGLDPSELSQDETIESLEHLMAEKNEAGDTYEAKDPPGTVVSGNVPRPKSVIYVDHENPFDTADQASGDPHINVLSRNSWVCCGDGVYVLECLGKGYVRVEPVGEDEVEQAAPLSPTEVHNVAQFVAHYVPPTLPRATAFMLKISPHGRSKLILRARTLQEAIRGCDLYAANKVLKALSTGLLRTAKWRKDPATPAQRQFIQKRRSGSKLLVDSEGDGDKSSPQNITKGEAANMITRLKHGALKRFEKKQRERAKLLLAARKESMRKAREDVKVGPLSVAI